MGWLAQVIAYHPFVVLIAVTVFSLTCLIVPLSVTKLPNFQDPQLGFETRGTEISQRLVAYENLINSVGPFKRFTAEPPITPINKKQKKLHLRNKDTPAQALFKRKRQKRSLNVREGGIREQIPFEEKYTVADLYKRYNISFGSKRRQNHDSDKDWESLKAKLQGSEVRHLNRSQEDYFCNDISYDYARFVITSTDGSDLFTYKAISSMCRLETDLLQSEKFVSICTEGKTKYCCPRWSLPNYVAILSGKTTCLNVTEEDVTEVKRLFHHCKPRFVKFEQEYLLNEQHKCVEYNAIYDMIHYIFDFSYNNESTTLRNVMVFLPIARGSMSLDYYYEIMKNPLKRDNVEVVAVDFGLKYTLFDEYLIYDTQFMFYGAVCILIVIWLYNGSFFVTLMTLLAIVFSLGISYFLYRLVFGIKFFPFMNLLASVVAIGIGGDASLIIYKLWVCAKEKENNIKKIVQNVHSHAILCTLVSSLTTSIAFYSSFISKITTMKCFSIFAGTTVVANFFLLTLWAPATLVVSEKMPSVGLLPQAVTSWIGFASQTIKNNLIELVMSYKHIWLLVFTSIGLLSFPIIFVHPKLRLPDSSDLQLFSSSHLFEKYDMVYKDKFNFERLLMTVSWNNRERKMPMRFVWGVAPIDNGDWMDPFERGEPVIDEAFDLASKESQTWILSFCTKLKMKKFYQPTFGPLVANCFIEPFIEWMKQKCMDPIDHLTREPCCESASFPYNRTVFSTCFPKAALSLYNTPSNIIIPTDAGPKFETKSKTPKVAAFVVEFESSYLPKPSFELMDNFFNVVEEWVNEEFSYAPAGTRNGWFISDLGLYDLQKTLMKDTITSVVITLVASFLVVTVTTLNLVLSLCTMITITFTISTIIAVLVLFGWKLNILEAVSICLAIGLAVDFSMHYVINYRFAPENSDRESAVRYALTLMTGPITMAALTTLLSGALMLPSQVLAYLQIGTFLVVVMVVSWLYSTFFLTSLLSKVGPVGLGNHTMTSRELHELEALNRSRRRAEHSPSAASATTIIHEEDCEIVLSLLDCNTRLLERRSTSSLEKPQPSVQSLANTCSHRGSVLIYILVAGTKAVFFSLERSDHSLDLSLCSIVVLNVCSLLPNCYNCEYLKLTPDFYEAALMIAAHFYEIKVNLKG